MSQEAVRALQREKRNAQRQYVETRRGVLLSDRQQGVGDGLSFSRQNIELLKIELELAESPREKRAILEKMLEEARNVEGVLNAMRSEGIGGSVSDILQAKVERLNIQIQLEEAKAK